MPRKGRKNGGRRNGPRVTGSPNDILMVASTRSTGAAEVSFPKEDMVRKQGSWLLTQTPPRSIANQIYWIKGNVEGSATVSASVPTEVNKAFTLSDLTDLAGLTAFFDQYCLYSVIVNVNFNYTGTTPSGLGTMATAIDFDNVANLGTISAIEAFESCLITKVTASQSVQRLIHPCVAPALYGGSTFSAFGLQRSWVDSASPGTPHYGFRSFFISNVGTTLTATYDFTYVVGFRNNY